MIPQAKVRSDIVALVDRHDYAAIKKYLEPWLPADLAPILAELTVEQLAALFRCSSKELAAATFGYLPIAAQRKLLKALSQEQAAALLNALPPDDRTTFLDEMPLDVAMQMLSLLSPEERKVAQALLAYPENSVGRMMTLDFIAIHPEWTVGDAFNFIRTHGYDRETLNIVYVVDENGRLTDDIRVRRLLLAPMDATIRSLMDGNFTWLSATDPRERALELFRKYDRVALPVVDESIRLIGIVTVDDILDVAAEIATQDIQKLGGTEALDEPYSTISLAKMVRKRASWLVVLFLGEMLTATALGFFQDEIAKVVVLSLFMPLAISSGGNAGSQASTLVIRALALGELRVRDWWFVVKREISAGLSLGLILGAVGFLRITLWSTFSTVYGPHWMLIALTVGVSLVGIVLWGSLMGSVLPLILKKSGLDPATSSAPFVATLVDVTGLIIYFNVAYVFMKGVLL